MHWTYNKVDPSSDLEQGDILSPTPALAKVLDEVHPHFRAAKYLGFTVSTQSCDLVRRRKVKARYISIAVIRSLRDVLPRLLEQVVQPIAPGIFRRSARAEARDFLGRLFNQNEQAQGLFYLHPDADVGLGEPCVALLRINVSLRAEHYDALLEARTGRLGPEFRAKYGWLLGNLYSRTASPDWQDQPSGEQQLGQMISEALDSKLPERKMQWIEDELVVAGQSAGVTFVERNGDELVKELEKLRPKPPIERLIDEVIVQAQKVIPGQDKAMETLRNRLLNNGTVKKIVRTGKRL